MNKLKGQLVEVTAGEDVAKKEMSKAEGQQRLFHKDVAKLKESQTALPVDTPVPEIDNSNGGLDSTNNEEAKREKDGDKGKKGKKKKNKK